MTINLKSGKVYNNVTNISFNGENCLIYIDIQNESEIHFSEIDYITK